MPNSSRVAAAVPPADAELRPSQEPAATAAPFARPPRSPPPGFPDVAKAHRNHHADCFPNNSNGNWVFD